MKPTVGRIVHFTPHNDRDPAYKDQPHAAVITHVWNDECVNLSVFGKDDRDPFAGVQTSVNFKADHLLENGFYWEWPPRT